jgi:hypothetical protein
MRDYPELYNGNLERRKARGLPQLMTREDKDGFIWRLPPQSGLLEKYKTLIPSYGESQYTLPSTAPRRTMIANQNIRKWQKNVAEKWTGHDPGPGVGMDHSSIVRLPEIEPGASKQGKWTPLQKPGSQPWATQSVQYRKVTRPQENVENIRVVIRGQNPYRFFSSIKTVPAQAPATHQFRIDTRREGRDVKDSSVLWKWNTPRNQWRVNDHAMEPVPLLRADSPIQIAD